MKWVLVTGGTGFIGTNLCKRLLQEGEYVIAVDNHITSPQQQKTVLSHPHYRFQYHDITKPLGKIFSSEQMSIKTIYHLACPTGVPNLTHLAEEMILTCSLGTKQVLDLALMHDADVLFTSTSEVYGQPQQFPQSEEYTGNVSPIGIRSPYEEGKRFSETLVIMYVRKYQVRAKIVRVFNTYGPHMSPTDTRVIPRFIALLKQAKPLTVAGDGTHSRTFCFINDLITGIMIVQQQGKNGEVYNLGSDKEITIYELAQKILAISKKTHGIVFVPRFSDDHDRRLPSLEKTYQLGWKIDTSLDDGLRRTVEWYGL